MVEKFKFILLEFYCCGLKYPSHFYWGSSKGVFTFANILPEIYPWKGNSPSNNAVLVNCHCILPCWYTKNRFWKFLKLSFFHCPDQYFLNKTKEKKEKICSTILLVNEKNYSYLSWKGDVVVWWVWSFLTIQINIVAIKQWITSEV